MSSSIRLHRNYYVGLMRDFCEGRLPAQEFEKAFLEARRKDLERDDEIKRKWKEPYDEMLLKDYRDGKLSPEEFSQRWHQLWGYPRNDKWLDIFEKLFSDVEMFVGDPDLRAELSRDAPSAYLDEKQLRNRVKDYLSQLSA